MLTQRGVETEGWGCDGLSPLRHASQRQYSTRRRRSRRLIWSRIARATSTIRLSYSKSTGRGMVGVNEVTRYLVWGATCHSVQSSSTPPIRPHLFHHLPKRNHNALYLTIFLSSPRRMTHHSPEAISPVCTVAFSSHHFTVLYVGI